MQKYNTSLKKIQLPEYGRNIENLITYCKSIPDKEKRTKFAYGIVEFMARVKNDDAPTEDTKRVYWDHLALLANFELDIDYPFEVIQKEKLDTKPEPLKMESPRIRFRQYGLVVENMIKEACEMEDAERRLRLLELCANHMKLQFHLANSSADEDDAKVIHDLVDYVGPNFAEECYKVYLYSLEELKVNDQYDPTKVVATPAKKKKKKKKKK